MYEKFSLLLGGSW